MSCVCDSLTAGILKECQGNSGGNRRIWLTEKCNATVVIPSTDNGTRTLTMNASTKFYKFEFNKTALEIDEDKKGEEAFGTEYFEQKIVLKLNRREKEKRAVIKLMSRYKEMLAIAEDGNGLFHLYGETEGLLLKDLNTKTGAQKADPNGYTLTFMGEEADLACEVSAATIASMIAAGTIDLA